MKNLLPLLQEIEQEHAQIVAKLIIHTKFRKHLKKHKTPCISAGDMTLMASLIGSGRVDFHACKKAINDRCVL